MGHVYLIHFSKKLKHARHYIGYCQKGGVQARFERHKSLQGSKLLRACVLAGINFRVVRVWDDVDRSFERKLKNRRNHKLLCPVCTKK